MLCERDRRDAAGRADRRRGRAATSTSSSGCSAPRTRLVAVIHVSNALGTVNPVEADDRAWRTRRRAGAGRRRPGGVRTCRSTCRRSTATSTLLRPQDLRPDRHRRALRQGRAARGDAALPGRRRHDRSVTFEKTTYNALPYKFEAGTPNIAGAVGPRRRGRLPRRRSASTASPRTRTSCSAYAHRRAARRSPACASSARRAHKAGVLSFVMEGVHPHDIGTILDREGVAIRTGHHCAQPVMDRFGMPATARASFAFYNTREDVDALVAALHRRSKRGAFGLMSDLSELYQEVILDHNQRPRNFRVLDGATATQRGLQPALRRPADGLPRCRGRRHPRRRVRGHRLRDLDGLGLADDRSAEGQDRRPRRAALFERFHDMVTVGRPAARPPDARQARGASPACASSRRA